MFYFYALILVVYNLFMYAFFRSGIYDFLRLSKVSKTYIRKNRKGIKNSWLYSQINQEHSLGIIYYLNSVFLSLVLIFSVISIFFGYLEVFRIPIIVIAVLLCLVEIPTTVWSSKIDALVYYGRPFVLLAKCRDSDSKRYYSSVSYIFSWILPVLFVIFLIKEIFGI